MFISKCFIHRCHWGFIDACILYDPTYSVWQKSII